MRVGIAGAPCAKMSRLKAELLANAIGVEIIPPNVIPPDQAISDENIFELKTITELNFALPFEESKHKGQPWKKKGKNSRF